jgi:hypothetical protein
MKVNFPAGLENLAQAVVLTIGQIMGGLIFGIFTVVAVGAIYIFIDRPGNWQCNTKQIKTVDLVNVHFEFQAEECDAGGRYVQIKTAIIASRRGAASSAKIFEYLVSHRGGGEVTVEEVGAHTLRITIPAEEDADRESAAARYMGLRTWGDLTFIYGRNPSDAPPRKVQ